MKETLQNQRLQEETMHTQYHRQLIDLWFHPEESPSFQNNAFKAIIRYNQ
jgi:hypothetical protein